MFKARCPNCNYIISGVIEDITRNNVWDCANIAFAVCPFCADLLRIYWVQPTSFTVDDEYEITISRKCP